jgi:hypothetical protein
MPIETQNAGPAPPLVTSSLSSISSVRPVDTVTLFQPSFGHSTPDLSCGCARDPLAYCEKSDSHNRNEGKSSHKEPAHPTLRYTRAYLLSSLAGFQPQYTMALPKRIIKETERLLAEPYVRKVPGSLDPQTNLYFFAGSLASQRYLTKTTYGISMLPSMAQHSLHMKVKHRQKNGTNGGC